MNKSNIVETGYTQGYEYSTPSGKSYKGYYHKDIQGRYWAGEMHTNASFILTPLDIPKLSSNNNFIAKYNRISANYTKKYTEDLDTPLLKHQLNIPTDDDYSKGYFTRYVAQLKSAKNLVMNIIEINKPTFEQSSKDIKMLHAYKLAAFNWKLTGNKDDVFEGNIRIEAGIYDANLRSLQDVEKVIPGISLFITDPLQYALFSFKEM
jgi:hypothetical protein